MASVGEVHTEIGVPRLKHGKITGHVCLRAGMRLHVCVIGAEKFLGTCDRQGLDLIDELTAAIVSLAWVTLCILIRHYATLSFQYRLTHYIFGGDQLKIALKPLGFLLNRGKNFWIRSFEKGHRVTFVFQVG